MVSDGLRIADGPRGGEHEWRQQAIAGLSALGLALMATTGLRQAGVIRHLPDPPIRGFRADAVATSSIAYPLGIPDSLLGVIAFTPDLLAATIGRDRFRRNPRLALGLGLRSAVAALVASWHLIQMPTRVRAWCAYCLVADLATWAIFALTVPDTLNAWRRLRRR